jgi:hypothetical protein
LGWADPDPRTDTPDNRITYTIGHDVISQSDSIGVRRLLYDRHGSTWQLVHGMGGLKVHQYDLGMDSLPKWHVWAGGIML